MKIHGEKDKNQVFGGEWTEKKLDAVERYLRAFTTALRNKFDDLVYVDLFAGTGFSESNREEYPLTGSAIRALQVKPPFGRFIFVEKDADKCKKLKENISNRDTVKNLSKRCQFYNIKN